MRRARYRRDGTQGRQVEQSRRRTTLFLDEVSEMSASTPGKVSPRLEEHSFERVGGRSRLRSTYAWSRRRNGTSNRQCGMENPARTCIFACRSWS